MAVPTPTEVSPWYLRNINQALALDETSGQVYVRTGITGDVYITGPVTIPGTVTVNSSPEDPVHTHVSEVGTSGILTTPNMPISIQNAAGNPNSNTYPVYVSGNVGVTGSVNIGTMPEVEIKNDTGNPVPINGTVNIGTMPEVEIKNDTGNPVPISGTITANQGTNPWVVSGNVNATIAGTATVALSSTQTDAFGRLRVSNPLTLFDTQARYYDHNQFSNSLSGAGTVAYNANASTFSLNVNTASGDSVIRETMKVFPYQPGKSLLIYNSFSMNAPKANLRQRVGFFGVQNGIFFEVDSTTKNFVIRSYSNGSIVEDRIPQSSWNGDRLNGAGGVTNPSGITLNPEYDQILWTDVEWLGVGSVRCGFVINGAFYTCHTFHHANIIGNTTTYMTTAMLPIRYEITNTGITGSNSTLTQICSSVISEGGYTQTGSTETAGTGISPKRLTDGGTYYPMVSIRLASTRLDAIVSPTQIDVLSPSVNYYRWVLLKNATLTGATWAGTSSTGSVQYDLAATGVSGGIQIESGYASSRELATLDPSYFQNQLGRTLAGVSDTVTLAITSISNNADVLAQMGWQELT